MKQAQQHSSKVNTGERLFTPVFVMITAVTLCCFATSQGLNAGTSVYISRLGETATLAGIGAAVFSISALVGRLISGPLADARGRLVVVTAGAVILFAGVFGAAFSASIDLIMLWRALQGLGFSGVTTAAATAAADVLPAARLGEGIGYYGLGQALAMTIGPALGIALVMTDPAENLYWGLMLLVVLAFVLSLFCRYEKHPERLPKTATYRTLVEKAANGERKQASTASTSEEKPRESFFAKFAAPGALAGGIPILLFAPAAGFQIYFIGLLGSELGMANAGVFFTVAAVTMILVRVSSKAFMDRLPAFKLYAFAVVMGLVSFAMMFVASLQLMGGVGQDVLYYGSGIFYGVCFGLALPVNQTVAVKNSPPEKWGAANGLFMLLFDLGIGVTAVVWGITNDLFGFPFTIACVAILVAASLAAAWITYPPFAK